MFNKILIATLVICTIFACESTKEPKEIVFVCTHGAARSPIASAYFNKLAKENNLDYHSVFRGTEPDEVLSKETITGLTKDGFEITNWKPAKISIQDVEKADRVITFDCSVPLKKSPLKTVEWNGTPSISKDYNVARTAIRQNVEKLIENLKKEEI